MEEILISRLNDFEDIHKLVRNEFSTIRDVLAKSTDDVKIIFDDFIISPVNLSSLTMLTSFLYSVRSKYNKPFQVKLKSHIDRTNYYDFKFTSFLKSVKFIDITKELRILDWDVNISNQNVIINPNTGIKYLKISELYSIKQYYTESTKFDKEFILFNSIKNNNPDSTFEEIEYKYESIKILIKNEIRALIYDSISEIFKDGYLQSFKLKVISYVSELLLNSFIHGRANPFFSIQKSSKRINITVCDTGVGLKESYKKLHRKTISEDDSILYACKHRIDDSYGLYDVIMSVLGMDKSSFILSDAHHGFVTISADSRILKLTRNNFQNLIKEDESIKKSIYNTNQIIRGLKISMDILIKE